MIRDFFVWGSQKCHYLVRGSRKFFFPEGVSKMPFMSGGCWYEEVLKMHFFWYGGIILVWGGAYSDHFLYGGVTFWPFFTKFWPFMFESIKILAIFDKWRGNLGHFCMRGGFWKFLYEVVKMKKNVNGGGGV